MGQNYDFSGYATRNDLLCADGKTIRKNAFKENDGRTVPLIWNHNHTDQDAVIGHALLENREDGVYAYCKFNDTENGQHAKKLVMHGDVRSLSIWANRLKMVGKDVVHGMIRELSLVLAGANPGAEIDFVMAHSDDGDSEEMFANYDESALIVYHSDVKEEVEEPENEEKGEDEVTEENKNTEIETESEIQHADGEEKTVKEVFDTLNEEQKKVVYFMIGEARKEAGAKDSEDSDDEDVQHSDEETEIETESEIQHADGEEKTVKEVFDTLNEEQKKVVYFMIGEARKGAEDEEEDDEEVEHSDLGGENIMKKNVFDNNEVQTGEVLSHSEMQTILEDAKRGGSLREAVISHGIEDIDILFPDAKALENEPGFIKRNDDWVAKVLGGVHHSPFSRIKTIFADITAAQARAKGYQKGKLKIEEVFKLLKRVTNPTTVYKKQALDRDDILDITDFNILPWLKREVRMMLDEEIARAILIGDGRDPVEEADDKIDEECIRPIWKMEDLFTVKVAVEVGADTTAEDRAKAFIKACIKSRKEYKGSGNPDMYMSEDMLTDCLLIEDKNGRVIYDTVQKLAATLRVREIVAVPVMEGLTRADEDGNTFELAAIYVNLKDYNVGTDKGGEVNFFDDFDIDYNKQKYLMETRCSGTLTKPYSAVAIEFKSAKA